MEMEADYNFFVGFLINKILISIEEEAGFIPGEDFISHKGHREYDVALYRRLFWDRLINLRNRGGLRSKDADQWYDIVVHLVAFISAQSWGLPLPNIPTLLSTLLVMTFFLIMGFGYSDCIYRGIIDYPFQGLYQVNGVVPDLWLCVSTYVMKLLT